MKNKIIIGALCAFSLLSITKVNALDNGVYSNYCSSPKLEEINTIDRTKKVAINGVMNPLYCTFNNQETAIANIKIKTPDLLNTIRNYARLDELSDSNWKQYRDNLNEIVNTSTIYTEGNEDVELLKRFFDIYENDEKNNNIVEKVNNNYGFFSSANAAEGMDVAIMLPDYAPLATDYNNTRVSSSRAMTFNTNNGISYASTYATSPNTSSYHYFSNGDCANFTSQILENGGVSQVVTDSEYTGWWHKTSTFLFWTTHTHSQSWSLADVFARYMGIGYTTTNHESFSANIQAGDFVSLDFGSDGDWDHMGFITQRNSGGACYPNGDYYNYKLAQHTSNYHAWASDSDTNHWPTQGANGARYARVRR